MPPSGVRRLPIVLACLATAAALLAGNARAGIQFGVTEDASKFSTDGGAAVLADLVDLGMSENAVSVAWDPAHPQRLADKALLDRLVATAAARRVRVVFVVYGAAPDAFATTPAVGTQFGAFLQLLARSYPSVRDFVIGNEPNYGAFWVPQTGAGAAYESLLAHGYDALKAVDPRIDVVGMGLAARGNGVTSTSPVVFLHDAGEAYRQSGRTRPLMDALAYHPYPASSVAPVDSRQGWPDAGLADLDRIKQAVYDAFHGTAQPTFEDGLSLRITEIGWQAAVSAPELGAYRGTENVRTTDEATQAEIYSQVVRRLECDPSVTDVLFFHLIDEPDLRGFQSGLIRADGSLRPSYAAVKSTIAETGGRCTGSLLRWHHDEGVVGANVEFAAADGPPRFTATAAEGVVYRAAIVPVEGSVDREAIAAALEAAGIADAALRARVPARERLETPSADGRYVQAVLLQASLASERSSLFVSAPFSVSAPPGATAAPAAAAPTATAPAATSPAPPTPDPVRTSTSPAAEPVAPQAPVALEPLQATAPPPPPAPPPSPTPLVFRSAGRSAPAPAAKPKPASLRFRQRARSAAVPPEKTTAAFSPRITVEQSRLPAKPGPAGEATSRARPPALQRLQLGGGARLLSPAVILLLLGAAAAVLTTVRLLHRRS